MDEDGPAAPHQPRAVRRHARPGPLLDARRALSRTGRSCCRWARSTRRDARRKKRRRRSSTTSSSSPTTWSRPAPTASTWTPPAPPATATSSPPSRPARSCAPSTPTWASRSAWRGEFVIGMHGQVTHRRRAPRRPLAQGPARAGAEGGGEHLRALRQHQHRQVDGLEHRPRDHHHQAVHGDRRDPRPRQRRHGRRRRADLRLPAGRRDLEGLARPSSRSSRSTGTRRAPVTPRAWRARTRTPRAWADYRTAGDLVARMQMTRRMRLKEAKQYVAGKLGCSTRDLSTRSPWRPIRPSTASVRWPAPRRCTRRGRHDRGEVQHQQGARHADQLGRALQGARRAVEGPRARARRQGGPRVASVAGAVRFVRHAAILVASRLVNFVRLARSRSPKNRPLPVRRDLAATMVVGLGGGRPARRRAGPSRRKGSHVEPQDPHPDGRRLARRDDAIQIDATSKQGSRRPRAARKVEPLTAGRARPPARHLRLGGALHRRRHRRRGDAELRRHRRGAVRPLGGLLLYEQCLASDSLELFHQDYSYKAVKTLVPHEQMAMKEAQERLTIPVHYGSQPDLGRYSEPDGPCPNWSTLLPDLQDRRGARRTGAGDGAGRRGHGPRRRGPVGGRRRRHQLRHRRRRRRRRPAGDAARRRDLRARHPDMGIMVGMAAERVLGTHGELEFHGTRVAGQWPPGQQKLVEQAGATIYGPAVNVNTGRSLAWNTSPALALAKPCVAGASIPVHMNVGHGRRRRADAHGPAGRRRVAGAPRRPSRSCASTACRSAPAISSACPWRTACAAGIGGMRAAGDLVARLQMAKGMRLAQAKTYVAGRLGVARARPVGLRGDAGDPRRARAGQDRRGGGPPCVRPEPHGGQGQHRSPARPADQLRDPLGGAPGALTRSRRSRPAGAAAGTPPPPAAAQGKRARASNPEQGRGARAPP